MAQNKRVKDNFTLKMYHQSFSTVIYNLSMKSNFMPSALSQT